MEVMQMILSWGKHCTKKSGDHQLLVVYPIICEGFLHPRWCKISAINSSTSQNCLEDDFPL